MCCNISWIMTTSKCAGANKTRIEDKIVKSLWSGQQGWALRLFEADAWTGFLDNCPLNYILYPSQITQNTACFVAVFDSFLWISVSTLIWIVESFVDRNQWRNLRQKETLQWIVETQTSMTEPIYQNLNLSHEKRLNFKNKNKPGILNTFLFNKDYKSYKWRESL